ncbi:30S ribosomal protein S8 [bacterium BMS3Abin15]|nr:30S ribosomal protein S8 [bacterium BMS3Abin15]
MLTRIRNAQMSGHKEVIIPASKLKMAIAKILEKNDFIEVVRKDKSEKLETIKIILKYNKISTTRKTPAITGIKRVSKEGQRIYVKKNNIGKVKNGYGIAVISTPKGVMTGAEARKIGLGGECICEVW